MIIPKDAVIVSKDGEIIGELKQGDRVFTAKAVKLLQDKATTQAYKPDGWISAYTGSIQRAVSLLKTGAEQDIFFFLLQHVRRNGNAIRFKNGKAITLKTVSEQTGIKYRTANKAIITLKKHGIIVKKGNDYIMNPYIVWGGKYIENVVVNMFKGTVFAEDFQRVKKE